VPKPAAVPWEVAGALPVAGFTVWAAVRAVGVQPGDTLVVSGAVGGVGSLTVQLARRAGATVTGVAGEANHAWLQSHGVIPVAYGAGVADRIRAAAQKAGALIGTYGGDCVEIALNEFGVQPARADTTVRFDAVEKYGVMVDGNAAAPAPRRCANWPSSSRTASWSRSRHLPACPGPRGVPAARNRLPPRQDRPDPLTARRRSLR